MSHIYPAYRESRIAYQGTTRRISLDPLLFRGVPITSLGAGDYIRFTVYNADGTILQARTDATYSVIYEDLSAWAGIIAVGNLVQTITIIWDLAYESALDRYSDSIAVQASLSGDRVYHLVADGVIVEE